MEMNHLQPVVSFDYFYGGESEQFSYYRIPRLLVTGHQFKNLSTDAKLLYGLMLDRMGLSARNGWSDEKGRVYIFYSLEEVMADLNCGHDKAVKMLADLDTVKGIGLIERVKQGQGKPTIIYVKQFTTKAVQLSSPRSMLDETQILESRNLDFGFSEAKTSEKQNSGLRKSRSAEFGNQEVPIYNNYPYDNYLDKSYLYLPINPSNQPMDAIDREKATECVKENIGYIAFTDKQRPLVDELVELIVDALCSPQATFRIGGVQFKQDIVKKRLIELEQAHIEYVLDCMRKNTTKVRNIRGYLLTALYNAPTTIEHYYQAAVQHDLHRR